MTGWDDAFESMGDVAIYGFGDHFVKRLILAYLARIPLDACLDYVANNKDLLANVPEKYWGKLRVLAKVSKMNITVEEIVVHLQKNRPDVLSIIINHPNGKLWLDSQVTNCRRKLGIIS